MKENYIKSVQEQSKIFIMRNRNINKKILSMILLYFIIFRLEDINTSNDINIFNSQSIKIGVSDTRYDVNGGNLIWYNVNKIFELFFSIYANKVLIL